MTLQDVSMAGDVRTEESRYDLTSLKRASNRPACCSVNLHIFQKISQHISSRFVISHHREKDFLSRNIPCHLEFTFPSELEILVLIIMSTDLGPSES